MPAEPDDALRARLADARRASLAWGKGWHAARDALLGPRLTAIGDVAAGEAAAQALLADLGWLNALVAPMVAALAADPLFEPPLRASRDSLRTGAVLWDDPALLVTAGVLDHRAEAMRRLSPTLVMSGRLGFTRYVRAGGATLHRWRADLPDAEWSAGDAEPARTLEPIALSDGCIVRHDGRCEAIALAGATGPVASVTVSLRLGAVPFMREYDRASGHLLRTATLDEGAARTAMLLTLLRESGRRDAADCFDRASRDDAFFLRWDAMREWLGLDAAAALPRLAEMADEDPHPEVRAAATVTLTQLRRREASCPA